ncbi:MAG: hypothetical protein V1776_02910 [Candidatus Diapherotrites archaeon]
MSLLFGMMLLQIGGILGDLELIMKVVGLLFIISFVRSHIQHPILSVGLIIGLSSFLLFDFWKIFGGALFLYLLTMFGIIHILVDLSFLGGFRSPILNLGGVLYRKSAKREMPSQHEQHREQGREQEYEERQPHEEMEQEYGRGREHEYGNEHEQGYERGHSTPSPREMQGQRTAYERALRLAHQRRTAGKRGDQK